MQCGFTRWKSAKCRQNNTLYSWLQLGIEKYSLNLDFAVYTVSVMSFIQCGVRVYAGLPVVSEKQVSSYLSGKCLCFIPE